MTRSTSFWIATAALLLAAAALAVGVVAVTRDGHDMNSTAMNHMMGVFER